MLNEDEIYAEATKVAEAEYIRIFDKDEFATKHFDTNDKNVMLGMKYILEKVIYYDRFLTESERAKYRLYFGHLLDEQK